MADVSRFLDELYAVPPKEFTRARNVQVAELVAAAAYARLADELRQGRLASELSAPGFEVFADAKAGTELRLVRGGRPAESRSERAATQRAREQGKQERQARAAEAERQVA